MEVDPNRRIKRILKNWPVCLVCGDMLRNKTSNMEQRFCQKHVSIGNNMEQYDDVPQKKVNIVEYYAEKGKETLVISDD